MEKMVLIIEGESTGFFEETLKHLALKHLTGLKIVCPETPLSWERFFRRGDALAVVRAENATDIVERLTAVPYGTVFARVSDVQVWCARGLVPERQAMHELKVYEKEVRALIKNTREESLSENLPVFLRAARELWVRGLELTPALLADAVELLGDGEDPAIRSRWARAASALRKFPLH